MTITRICHLCLRFCNKNMIEDWARHRRAGKQYNHHKSCGVSYFSNKETSFSVVSTATRPRFYGELFAELCGESIFEVFYPTVFIGHQNALEVLGVSSESVTFFYKPMDLFQLLSNWVVFNNLITWIINFLPSLVGNKVSFFQPDDEVVGKLRFIALFRVISILLSSLLFLRQLLMFIVSPALYGRIHIS